MVLVDCKNRKIKYVYLLKKSVDSNGPLQSGCINFSCYHLPNELIVSIHDDFFSFLPPSQETCYGKVTQLYSGFGYEQIVKMA